jgi:hypothetical protein
MCPTVQTETVFATMLRLSFRYVASRRAGSLKYRPVQEAAMSLSAWIVLGLIAGFFSRNFVNGVSPGVGMDDVLGLSLLLVAYYAVSRHTRSE